MKIIIPAVALIATAFGNPTVAKRWVCTPGTYSCTPDNTGWQVCGVSGNWVFAGVCPPNTGCVFDDSNQSPYCVPPGYQIP
ncbi:hypothetical protein OIDMADRAFT_184256 [Oidiodendron maius Zn]|uniref:Carbohydrate-binding module family 19 domain-containing protein n=1 Tax=Oidiodendron maius (strain Zn) TaxID=913774 RepID=A0A0C3CY24_OIDMZ|nr:hypothetical protein OIDMADRAFT_184256 [Oidiodendron maius Zn]